MEEDTAVMVTEEDFMEAHRELVPSVSADELRHYDRVRRQFEGAGKKDDEQKADGGPASQQPSNGKGKGKAIAPVDETEGMTIQAADIELNGDGDGTAQGSGKGKGKAATSNHGGKSSVDIAEGGFGESTEDGDLYS